MAERMVIIDENGSFEYDADELEQVADSLGARIILDDSAAAEFRRVLQGSGSTAYALLIAERASALAAKELLNVDEYAIATVPLFAGRLARFLHEARLELALFRG